MDQGNCLDSTPVSAAQDVRGGLSDEPALNVAVTALLTRPEAAGRSLPEPGSDEAKAMFRAACTETDRLSYDAVHGYPDLRRTDIEWWTQHSLSMALDDREIEVAEYARLYSLAAEREHRIDAAALATNIGALQALAFADEYAKAVHHDAEPASADPIFAMIEEADRLEADASALLAICGGKPDSDPSWLPERKAHKALWTYVNEVLLETVPTTAAGGIALAQFAVKFGERQGVSISKDDENIGVLRLIAASGLPEGGQAPSKLEPTPDAHTERQADGVGSDDACQTARLTHEFAHRAFVEAVAAADVVKARRDKGCAIAAAGANLAVAETASFDAWCNVLQVRPKTPFGLLNLLRHVAEYHGSYASMDGAPDAFGALIGAVQGMLFASLTRPADHDLSQLSVLELNHLADIMRRERETLLAIEHQPFCLDNDESEHTPLGRIIEAEGERLAFLGEHAVAEIQRRRPTDKRDIDLRLEAIVRHSLVCEGQIPPDLLAEVTATWGAR